LKSRAALLVFAMRFTRRRFFALSLARKRAEVLRFFERAEVVEKMNMRRQAPENESAFLAVLPSYCN
jgi:hypothetical protein